MMWMKRLIAVVLVGGLLLAALLTGCTKGAGDRRPNLPPETMLSFSPEDGDTSSYRVRMNWFGWDPDGEIAYFLTRWDADDWARVVNTDSVFLVSASEDTVELDKGYEYHTFRVKSIDNEGEPDPTPEVISFTAFTLVPETQITRGPSGVTGPMVTLEWLGRDRDGVIAGFQYHLLRWNESGQGGWDQVLPDPLDGVWISVGPEDNSLILGPLDGLHRFEIRAIDDAGAQDQTPARREFTCNPGLAGPRLYIGSNVFGLFAFRGPVWPDDANIPIPIFAGERIRFQWAANGDDYGGEILGYRHAYDDTATWPAWSIYDRRFEITPEPGIHSLYVQALDNANVPTRARIRFEVIEATLNEYILIVDDWNDRETLPKWGTDADRTEFYDQLLAGYARERVEWEPGQHVGPSGPLPPTVDALQGASTVIWYCDKNETSLGDLFYGNVPYNTLAGYVRVGGNVVLCGSEVLAQIMNEGYVSNSITIAEDDTTEAAVFVRDVLRISNLTNSGANANKISWYSYGYCFYGGVPKNGYEDQFDAVYIDSVGPSGYPEPGKWPLYTYDPVTWPQYAYAGHPYVDRVETFQGTGIEFLGMDSYLNMNFEGSTCAVLNLTGDNHGNTCIFTFPLYYCQYDGVKALIDQILRLFGEEKIN
jgi:hypothetical protein